MHILKRELKANLKNLIIWSVIMVVFIFLMVSEFSAYYDNPQMADILDSMPEALKKAFSLVDADLTSPSGYISLASVYFYLMLSFYAILLGSNIVAKEERDKTAEYFLTLPVSRQEVLVFKWAACVLNCICISLITGGATFISMVAYDLDKAFFVFLALVVLALFIVEMVFLALGMALASLFKRYKNSGKYSAMLVMAFYILSVVSGLVEDLNFLGHLSPFKFFEGAAIIETQALPLDKVGLAIVMCVVSLVVTYIIYPKRDLNL